MCSQASDRVGGVGEAGRDGAKGPQRRAGEGKSGPGTGEESGRLLPAKGSAPRPPAEECGAGRGGGPRGGSVRDLGVSRQPTLAAPVGLPEAPVQLLQLWAQRQVAGHVHAEGLQPLLQLHEGGSRVTGGQDSGFPAARGGGDWPHPLGLLWLSPRPHLPLLRVQITAAHGNGKEARWAVWGAVAVQEASHVEAEVHGAGQVVRVSVHPPDDLYSTRPSSYPGAGGGGGQRPGATQVGLRADDTWSGASLTTSPLPLPPGMQVPRSPQARCQLPPTSHRTIPKENTSTFSS